MALFRLKLHLLIVLSVCSGFMGFRLRVILGFRVQGLGFRVDTGSGFIFKFSILVFGI